MSKQFDRFPNAAPAGGWTVTDEEAIHEARSVVWELIKQVGQAVTNGTPLTRISLPINIAEARSYCERLSDGWCYAPVYLTQAAELDDPVERLKLVITFALAGLSNTCAPKKPFNPILGETYEALYEDGTELFVEQSQHHPPITNWEMIGPGSNFHFYGHGEWTASFRGNSVLGHQVGTNYVTFKKDKQTIAYELPQVWVRGVMWGERIVEYDGTVVFRDDKNNLYAELKFNPEPAGWFSGWGKKRQPTDHFVGGIYEVRDGDLNNKKQISQLLGSWMGAVEFDGKLYWTFNQDIKKFKPKPIEHPLPSDCRYREDIIFLAQKDFEKASEWKSRLEEKQRAEARLRKNYSERTGIPMREH